MARITVEDCLDKVDNRFELVMVSSKRARQIQTGGKDALVSEDNDKPTVIALREIAEGKVDAGILVERPSMELDEESLNSPQISTTPEPSEVQASPEAQESTESSTIDSELAAAISLATETEEKPASTPPED